MKCNRSLFTVLLLSTFIGGGCKKDDTHQDPPNADIHYVFANVAGARPNQTTYLVGTTDLNFTQLNNANGAEQTSFASMWQYKQTVYLTASGAPATMTKYTFDQQGKPVQAGKLIVPGANTFSSIEFINDTLAFASVGGGLARLVRFNPTELRITGEINLAPLQKAGTASTYYLGMKAREGKLFMGVHYFNAAFAPLYDSAFVAVIDITQNKVEKLLSDGRSCAIFLAGSSVNGFVLDSNNDLYIQAQGSANVPSGVLRIKKNETHFDPGYFFDLKAATGKDCRSLWHFGNNLTFTTRLEDPANPYESTGPAHEYYRIDLVNKASLGKLGTLPRIFGSSTSIMRQVNDQEIFFVVASATENSMYSYSIANGGIAKKFSMTGTQCTGFAKIK